jgi:hypothetical protein
MNVIMCLHIKTGPGVFMTVVMLLQRLWGMVNTDSCQSPRAVTFSLTESKKGVNNDTPFLYPIRIFVEGCRIGSEVVAV